MWQTDLSIPLIAKFFSLLMTSCHAFSLFRRLAIPLCQLPVSILTTCLYVELHFETLSMKHCDSARQLKINLGNIIVKIEAEKFY